MTERLRLVLLCNLLQDVNMIRPLALLAARRLDADIRILVAARFMERDVSGAWAAEVASLASETDATVQTFASEAEAFRLLQNGRGMILAGSESDVSAHATTHGVFLVAPPGYLRVTLQHGFECIGIHHNRAHDASYGKAVRFAADVVCVWSAFARLASVAGSERSKLYLSGPPLLIPESEAPAEAAAELAGLVCENLHSVRLNVGGDFKMSFMDAFRPFCDALAQRGERVVLRPHPGGQYMFRNNIALPDKVGLETRPIYQVPLKRFAYGISAPSSVLIDMLLAGIPVAVWQDPAGTMDIANYAGLPVISTADEWLAFRDYVASDRDGLLRAQRRFLDGTGMLLNPAEVERRFLSLLTSVLPLRVRPVMRDSHPRRIAFIANAVIPTLEIYFTRPLAAMQQAGEVEWCLITEAQMKEEFANALRDPAARESVRARLDAFEPDLIVFCRYSGPHAEAMAEHARLRGVPTILHLDDDLLNVPIELGEKKFSYHNHPKRLAAVRHLLENVDLVFCSTEALCRHFMAAGFKAPMWTGKIAVGAEILSPAEDRPVQTIGYMGFDHERDFQIALPAVMRLLRKHPLLRFELFGAIPRPRELEEFGERVEVIPPVRGYGDFLAAFVGRRWDIGICPLQDTAFNARKSNLKWVEYTSAGVATVAMAGMVYDDCASDGCALLATSEEDWFSALDELVADQAVRARLVQAAQARLSEAYSPEIHLRQVMEAFRRARENAARRLSANTIPTAA